MLIISESDQIKSCLKAKNMRINLKKERSKVCLALMLQPVLAARPVAVATGGRSRPLVFVIECGNVETLGSLFLRSVAAVTGGCSSCYRWP